MKLFLSSLGRIFVYFIDETRMCSITGCCFKLVCCIYCISHIIILKSKKSSDFKAHWDVRGLDDNCNSEEDCLCHLTESGKEVIPLTRYSG